MGLSASRPTTIDDDGDDEDYHSGELVPNN